MRLILEKVKGGRILRCSSAVLYCCLSNNVADCSSWLPQLKQRFIFILAVSESNNVVLLFDLYQSVTTTSFEPFAVETVQKAHNESKNHVRAPFSKFQDSQNDRLLLSKSIYSVKGPAREFETCMIG